jgi:hypothetical protein
MGTVGKELETERADKDIFNKKELAGFGRSKTVSAFHTLQSQKRNGAHAKPSAYSRR